MMISVQGIRRACSCHKRRGRRLEEMTVSSRTDVGGAAMNQQHHNLVQTAGDFHASSVKKRPGRIFNILVCVRDRQGKE